MARTLQAVGLFILIAIVVSWGFVGIGAALGVLSGIVGRTLVIWLFPAGPLVAALVVQRWLGRPFTPDGFGVSLTGTPWLPASWFVPVLLALATLLVEHFMPGATVSFSPVQHMPPLPADASEELRKNYEAAKSVSPIVVILGQLGMAMFFGALLNTFVALAEEVGWRGVLLKEFAPFGFWRVVLLTGLLDGMWSLPLVLLGEFYGGSGQVGLAMVVVFCLFVTPLTTFFRLASGSVTGAALFHGTLKSMQLFVALGYVAGNKLLVGVTGVAGLVVIAVATVAIVVPRWKEADQVLRAVGAEP